MLKVGGLNPGLPETFFLLQNAKIRAKKSYIICDLFSRISSRLELDRKNSKNLNFWWGDAFKPQLSGMDRWNSLSAKEFPILWSLCIVVAVRRTLCIVVAVRRTRVRMDRWKDRTKLALFPYFRDEAIK